MRPVIFLAHRQSSPDRVELEELTAGVYEHGGSEVRDGWKREALELLLRKLFRYYINPCPQC